MHCMAFAFCHCHAGWHTLHSQKRLAFDVFTFVLWSFEPLALDLLALIISALGLTFLSASHCWLLAFELFAFQACTFDIWAWNLLAFHWLLMY